MGAQRIRFRVQFSAPGCGFVLTPALDLFHAIVTRRVLAAQAAAIVVDTRAMRAMDRKPFTVRVAAVDGSPLKVHVVACPHPAVLTTEEISCLHTTPAAEPVVKLVFRGPGTTPARSRWDRFRIWLDAVITRLIGPRRPIGT